MPITFDDAPDLSALNGFSGNRLNRMGEQRDQGMLARSVADPAARYYVFGDGRAFLKTAGGILDPLFSKSEADALQMDGGSVILLGFDGEAPRLAGLSPLEDKGPNGETAIAFRSLAMQGAVSTEHLGAIAQGGAMLNWHRNHQFCSTCGGKTGISQAGYRRDCPACGRQHFPRTDPVVIMLAVTADKCLLGRSPHFNPGMYSCLAGFLEPGETLEDAVRREIEEESGIRCNRVRYASSQPWPFPMSLMTGFYAEAVSQEIVIEDEELEDCRWFDLDEVQQMLAGTHPDGLMVPPPMAIAHQIIKGWAGTRTG